MRSLSGSAQHLDGLYDCLVTIIIVIIFINHAGSFLWPFVSSAVYCKVYIEINTSNDL